MSTLISLFEACVEKYSDHVFLLEKKNNRYTGSTFKEIREKVHLFGAGLTEMGIQKGDRIALLSEGRNDWVISELGILYAGAVNVPLSQKLTEPSEIKYRLVHAGVRFIIVSKSQSKKIISLKNELPDLEKIILLDQQAAYGEMELPFNEVILHGRALLEKNPQKFTSRWQSIVENDYANICYTSGTTADPKGIILTHRNYTANVEQALTLFNIPRFWTTLLYLPWDHAFAHTCGIYALMSCGASAAALQIGETANETLRNIPVNIKEIRPYFLMSVPAVAKNFRKNIEKGIRDKGKVAQGLFNFGLKIAYAYNGNGWNKGKGMRFLLKPFLFLFDKILFSKVRQAFGGKLQYFIGGGAILDMDIQKFFYALGMPMYQGYGLTEASPVISSNNPDKHKMGSSGSLVKYIELKICDDEGNSLPVGQQGEIVIRGENVMAGYWKNPEATAETIKNGWLFTGDRGYMDEDGFLYVLGRFKSLLIADDGEKYSPENIEESLVFHSKYIEQVLLYNNQNPYTTALIFPNFPAIKGWLEEKGINATDEKASEEVIRLIRSQIDMYLPGGKHQNMFPSRWLPSAFTLIAEGFTEDNHMLNSMLKTVRPKIHDHYKNEIDYMYSPQGKNIYAEHNAAVVKRMIS